MINRWRVAAFLFVLLVLAGGAPRPSTRIVEPNRPPPRPGDLSNIDQRTEDVAKAICVSRGIDPNFEGPPYPPGPVWRMFVREARDFVAAYDALKGKK